MGAGFPVNERFAIGMVVQSTRPQRVASSRLLQETEADVAASAIADLDELQRSGARVVWPSCLREQPPASVELKPVENASLVPPRAMAGQDDTSRPRLPEREIAAAEDEALRDLAELQKIGYRVSWPV